MAALDILGWLTVVVVGAIGALIFLVFLLVTVDEPHDAGRIPETGENHHG